VAVTSHTQPYREVACSGHSAPRPAIRDEESHWKSLALRQGQDWLAAISLCIETALDRGWVDAFELLRYWLATLDVRCAESHSRMQASRSDM
jgi:hypothetical protein